MTMDAKGQGGFLSKASSSSHDIAEGSQLRVSRGRSCPSLEIEMA